MKILKNKIVSKFIIITTFISCLLASNLTVNAGYEGNGQVQGGVNGGVQISISSQPLIFDDHRGMSASINGRPVFCIQRGYPFRSMVSELQMVDATFEYGYGSLNGTISSLLRYLLRSASVDGGGMEYFRGFGEWEINDDHTDAVLVSINGAPTSLAWQEVFDEDREDDEYENRYQGTREI